MVSSRVCFPVVSVDNPLRFRVAGDPPLRARGRTVQPAPIVPPPQGRGSMPSRNCEVELLVVRAGCHVHAVHGTPEAA